MAAYLVGVDASPELVECESMTPTANWILGIMLSVNPPGRTPVESEEAGRARYVEIANAIDSASGGNRQLAALLASVSFYESGWRADVDDGRVRGDGGRACTLWQLRLPREQCDELVLDRERAARHARAALERSLRACRGNGPEERLAAYTGGSCDRGLEASRRRWRKAQEWLAR
jgi:hypothetical protein